MAVKDCYEMINGDYEGVLSRLLKDERIEKYLHKFAEGDYLTALTASIEAEEWEEAFRNVHSLKGMCLNLGFEDLLSASEVLCEELRCCRKPEKDISQMVTDLREKYDEVLKAINSL